MPKALSCQLAALSLDRFSAETITALVPGASRQTISDAIRDLEQKGQVRRLPVAEKLVRGRPRQEYGWTEDGRLACRRRLEEELPGFGPARTPRDYVTFDVDDAEPFDAGLEQIKALVDAALAAETGERRGELGRRAEAEFEALTAIEPANSRLSEARRQLARLRPAPEPVHEPEPVRDFWSRVVDEARSPILEVLEHFGAPVMHPVAAGQQVRQGAHTAAAASEPDDQLTLILDTSVSAPWWLGAYVAQQEHDCAVLHIGDLSAAEMEAQFGKLLGYFVTPVSANTHIAVIAEDTAQSRSSLGSIGRVFGDPSIVRSAMTRSRAAFAAASSTVENADVMLGYAAVSPTLAEPDWVARGLRRRFVLDVMVSRDNVSSSALLKATMNDPVVVCPTPLRPVGASNVFAEVQVSPPRDVVTSLSQAALMAIL